MSAYSPSSADLEIAKLSNLLDSIETANASVDSNLSAVQTVRDERLALFNGDGGLIKIASQVRDYIASVLDDGKKARDFVKAQKIVQKMRGVRLTKNPWLKKAAKHLKLFQLTN